MTNPLKSNGSHNLGLLLARLPIGVLFCWEAYIKLHDIGLNHFVAKFIGTVPAYMPPWFGHNFLLAVPFLELLVGLMLVLGLFTRIGGFIASAMLISFTIAATGIRSSSWPFHPNLIFLGVTLMLMFLGGGNLSVDGWLGRKHGSPSKPSH